MSLDSVEYLSYMAQKENWPDDDGEKTMVWVRDGRERERIGCEKVYQVFSQRPWVRGKVVLTESNSPEDGCGIDMFVPVVKEMLEVLDIKGDDRSRMPVQIKSSRKAVREFLKKKRMIGEGKFRFRDGSYTITVNGTDAKLLILADIVGQMIVLSVKSGVARNEEDFLHILGNYFHDEEAVLVWQEQREVVLDQAWYNGLI